MFLATGGHCGIALLGKGKQCQSKGVEATGSIQQIFSAQMRNNVLLLGQERLLLLSFFPFKTEMSCTSCPEPVRTGDFTFMKQYSLALRLLCFGWFFISIHFSVLSSEQTLSISSKGEECISGY